MAIEGTVDRLSIKIETQGVAEAQKQLDSLSSTLKTFRKLNEKMTGTGLEQAGKDAEDASHGIATAGEEVEVTAEKAEKSTNIFKRLAESFHNVRSSGDKTTGVFARLGESFKKTFTHLGTFAAALKRIAMYRFLRSIIKAITAAIGEGITNIYNYSRTVGTSLAPAMDKAKSASLTFKNSIGAALAPVLEALIPVLVRVCEWLTKFNNLIAAVFASLAGKSTYTAAVDATATWGDNLSSAAGAAKELKRQLLGFDELNVLSAPSSGGGGGGGSTTPDYSSMFEERDVPNKLAEWIDEFKLVFNNVVLDWSNINGEQLAEKIISGLFTVAGLIVGGVPGAVVGFLLSLLVNKTLFDQDGKISKQEWKNIVGSMFAAIGGSLVGFLVGGVPGLLVGATLGFAFAVKLADWTTLDSGKNINDFFWSFDVIKESWEKNVVPWWENTFVPWFGGIIDDIRNTETYKVLTQQTEGSGLFASIRDWIFGTVTGENLPFEFLDNILPSAEDIGQFFSDIGGAISKGWNWLTKTTFKKIWDDTGKWVNEKVDAVSNWVTKAFDDLSNIDISQGMQNIGSTLRTKFSGISNWWNGTAKPKILQVWESVSGWFSQASSDSGNSLENMRYTIVQKTDSIRETIRSKFESIGKKISETWDSIRGNADFSWGDISSKIGTKAGEIKNKIVTAFQNLPSTVSGIFSNVSSTATNIFNNMSLGTIANDIKDSVSKAFNNMQISAVDAFEKMRDNVKGPINGAIGFINRLIFGVVSGFNKAIAALNKISFTIPSWIPIIGGNTYKLNIKNLGYPPQINYLAEGGLVTQGQLFIARERGPELVGSYGNKSAVVNNDQIVESVSEGVYRAVVAAMGDQSTTVNIDGRTLFEIITERNNAQVRRTGRSPLLV